MADGPILDVSEAPERITLYRARDIALHVDAAWSSVQESLGLTDPGLASKLAAPGIDAPHPRALAVERDNELWTFDVGAEVDPRSLRSARDMNGIILSCFADQVHRLGRDLVTRVRDPEVQWVRWAHPEYQIVCGSELSFRVRLETVAHYYRTVTATLPVSDLPVARERHSPWGRRRITLDT